MGVEKESIFTGFYINEFINESIGFKVSNLKYISRIRSSINDCLLKAYIKKVNPDLIHYTYFTENINNKIPKIFTVYDMTVEKYPDLFLDSEKQTHVKRISCDKADHIISISHSTKHDLVNMFGIDSDKISVIHLGAEFVTPTDYPLITEKSFILYVGSRYEYKNFKPFIQAYSRSKSKDDFDLVCFGPSKFNTEELNLIHDLNITGSVHHVTGSNDLLAQYYTESKLLVYPSMYEGFGLPIIEAMLYKTPVLCSKNSSLEEIGKHYVTYIDFHNFSTQIDDALEGSFEGRAGKLIDAFSYAKDYTWQKCANDTKAIYQRYCA
jgi:glycosyltransferase involved in cell wall biosynthesis